MRRLSPALALFALVLVPLTAVGGDVPPRPEKLVFPELVFNVPDAGALRFELADGTPVYAKADHQLPLVDITVFFRGGAYLEPDGQEGLAALASEVWRTGGAGERTAQQLDEELDFLAADLSTNIGDVSGSVSLNALAKDLDAAMAIMVDVLTKPRFQEDRFAKAKADMIQQMKTRNDHTATIEAREWDRLLYGDDYWLNRLSTQATVEALTPDACRTFVTSLARSANIVVAAAGDFEPARLKALLERTIGALPALAEPLPPIPQPEHQAEPGVYVVNKPDVNQGRVSIGHLGYRLGHPDEAALLVLNEILGGGGFTSRITKRVRSDEGLAYTARSSIRFPVSMPGTFRAYFQSKSSTCAYAAEIVRGLIDDVRTEKVGADELTTSTNSLVETFPRRFESAARTVSIFAADELLGRPHDYWTSYREKIRALSADDLLAAAKRDLHPESMIVLVVGNAAEIIAGHPDHEARITDFGPIHAVPLRDPLTLEPLPE